MGIHKAGFEFCSDIWPAGLTPFLNALGGICIWRGTLFLTLDVSVLTFEKAPLGSLLYLMWLAGAASGTGIRP